MPGFFFFKVCKIFFFLYHFWPALYAPFAPISNSYLDILSLYATLAAEFLQFPAQRSWVLPLYLRRTLTGFNLGYNSSYDPRVHSLPLFFDYACFSFSYGKNTTLFFFLEKNGMTWEALFYSNFLTLKTIAEYFVQFCTPWGIIKWWNYWTTADLMVPQGLPLQGTVGFLDLRAAQADFLIFLSGFPSPWSPPPPQTVSKTNFFFSKCDFRNRKILSFLKE